MVLAGPIVQAGMRNLTPIKSCLSGCTVPPATFQRLMTKVLGDLDGCTVYLDDVVVYSDTWSSHLEHIRALFSHLAEARLTVNLAKCEFARATVTYLGRVTGQGTMHPVQENIQAVARYPTLATKTYSCAFWVWWVTTEVWYHWLTHLITLVCFPLWFR